MKAILDAHNRKITNSETAKDNNTCNCRRADKCPLDGNCLQKNVIYRAEVKTKNRKDSKFYIGSTMRTFKERYNDHKYSFKNAKASSKLAKFIHDLKNKKQKYEINWTIVASSRQSRPNLRMCTLCNLERLEIARAEKRSLLNSRNELVTKCPHSRGLYF